MITKKQAGYTDKAPASHTCDKCINWSDSKTEGNCLVVIGTVSPKSTCHMWQSK